MAVGKVAAHLCLALIIKELKISVEYDRVVTTLNIIFSVVVGMGQGCEMSWDMTGTKCLQFLKKRSTTKSNYNF